MSPRARIVTKSAFLLLVTISFVFAARSLADFPRVVSVLLPIFNLLPDITGYFFAMAGVALIFMPDDLKKLEEYRRTRLVIATLIFLIGLGAESPIQHKRRLTKGKAMARAKSSRIRLRA